MPPSLSTKDCGTLTVPVARNADGSTITGPVVSRIANAPAGSTTQPIIRGRVTGTATPASFDTTKATLTKRYAEEGARVPIGASEWAFADCTQTPFPGKADGEKICLKGEFDPNALYEVTYTAKDPPVHGIGFAATRDLLAYLRRASSGNPLGTGVRYVLAQGTSQSGNYLRSFVHLGFNQDELGRRVIDGMNPHIAGRQVALNIRFAAPSGAAEMYEPGSDGVLTWSDYEDEARGRPSAGLLTRCRATSTCPKIIETFGAAEFFSLRMSPNLVGTRADRDIPLPENVRRYYAPSVNHGGGAGGFEVDGRAQACCTIAANPNSSNEMSRALMAAPKLLLIDEPSVGLAPIMVNRVIETIRGFKDRHRLTILMAEQNFTQAVRIADRGYVIVHGKIAFQGDSAEALHNNELIREFYLGA